MPYHKQKKSKTPVPYVEKFIKKTSGRFVRGETFFGSEAWRQDFATEVDPLPLPEELRQIMKEPCPFAGDASITIEQTHMAVLIPATVLPMGESKEFKAAFWKRKMPLNLFNLKGCLLMSDKPYSIDTPTLLEENIVNLFCEEIQKPYWLLLMTYLIPGSKGLSYENQRLLLEQYPGYSLPTAQEVAVCMLAERARSSKATQNTSTQVLCANSVDGYQVWVKKNSWGVYVSLVNTAERKQCGLLVARRFYTSE